MKTETGFAVARKVYYSTRWSIPLVRVIMVIFSYDFVINEPMTMTRGGPAELNPPLHSFRCLSAFKKLESFSRPSTTSSHHDPCNGKVPLPSMFCHDCE